jgi:hypothetical protein
MRYREQVFVSDVDQSEIYGFCRKNSAPYCPVDNVQVPFVSRYHVRSMCDVVTENFKKQSAEGEVILNRLYAEEFIATRDQPHVSVQSNNNGDNGYSRQGYTFSHDNDTGPWLTSCDPFLLDYIDLQLEAYEGERQIALAQAWANVDQSEMAMLASLGELPETLNWLKSLMSRLISVLRPLSSKKALLMALKPTKKKDAHAADMLDYWMEFRYAVRPLIFEAEQLRCALAKKFDGNMRFTARGYNSASAKQDTSNSYVGSWISTYQEGYVKRVSDYRAGVLYNFSTNVPSWISIFGLDQLIEAGWELTRLSFALDWIFNLGDILSSLTVPMACTPLGSWVTEYHEFTYHNVFDMQTYDPPDKTLSDVVAHSGDLTITRKLKRRTINPELSYLPRMKINLSAAKLVDLAAIGRSICRSIFR